MNVAVVGLYRSGSSLLAGMLHCLGVDMGSPYFVSNRGETYEPADLAQKLRAWWDEPNMVERVPARQRFLHLEQWGQKRQPPFGAKHPLLSLCVLEAINAWNCQVVWAYRPLQESIESLQRTEWFPGQEQRIQERLWQELHRVHATMPLVKIHHAEVLKDPAGTAAYLCRLLDLQPTPQQREDAARFVRVV